VLHKILSRNRTYDKSLLKLEACRGDLVFWIKRLIPGVGRQAFVNLKTQTKACLVGRADAEGTKRQSRNTRGLTIFSSMNRFA